MSNFKLNRPLSNGTFLDIRCRFALGGDLAVLEFW